MNRILIPVAFAGLLLAGCMTQPPAPAVDRGVQGQAGRPAAMPPVAGPGYYTVKRGDTLYRIALENGQDYRDLAAWNNIANPASIKEGQVLRIKPPGAAEGGEPAASSAGLLAPVVESRSLDSTPPPAAAAKDSDGLQREPRVGKEPYSDEAYARLNKIPAAPAVAMSEAPPDAKVEPKPEPKPEPQAPAGPDDVTWIWPAAGQVIAGYSESGNKGVDIAGKAGDPVVAASDGKVVYAGAGLRGYGELVIVKHNATFLSAYAHNRKILVKEGQAVTRGQRIAEMGNTDAESVRLHFEIRKQGKPIDPMLYLPKR
jgi:lipoprotein NlpD